MNVKTLSVGYMKNGVLDYTNAVKNGSIVDLSSKPGFTSSSLKGVTLINNGIIYGDVNGDGNIGINDVTLVQKHISDITTLTSEQIAVGDVDHDGEITINDATLIQKYIVGLVTSF